MTDTKFIEEVQKRFDAICDQFDEAYELKKEAERKIGELDATRKGLALILYGQMAESTLVERYQAKEKG